MGAQAHVPFLVPLFSLPLLVSTMTVQPWGHLVTDVIVDSASPTPRFCGRDKWRLVAPFCLSALIHLSSLSVSPFDPGSSTIKLPSSIDWTPKNTRRHIEKSKKGAVRTEAFFYGSQLWDYTSAVRFFEHAFLKRSKENFPIRWEGRIGNLLSLKYFILLHLPLIYFMMWRLK